MMNNGKEQIQGSLPQLTPQQALAELHQAVGQLTATRDIHTRLQQCCLTLQGLINSQEQESLPKYKPRVEANVEVVEEEEE